MNGLGLAVWMGLGALAPVERGDIIETGLYPAGVILQAIAALDPREIVPEDPTIATDGVWILRPTVVDNEAYDYFEMVLRGSGLYLVESLRHGEGRFLSVSRDPVAKTPEGPLRYQVQVVDIVHVGLAEAVAQLEQSRAIREGDSPRSRFVPYAARSRLILRCPNQGLLDQYAALIAKIDVPPPPGPALRAWKCQSHWADELLPLFQEIWEGAGHPPAQGVIHRATNSLMFRLTDATWAEVKSRLETLDPEPRKK